MANATLPDEFFKVDAPPRFGWVPSLCFISSPATMVNWSAPAEILKDSDVFVKIIFSIAGLFCWELVTTWGFEWSLITRRRRFRWPLVLFFFLSRYCMLMAIIGLIISLTVTHPINCGVHLSLLCWSGNMAILCASTSLMLRTIALWERKRSIVLFLGGLSLAHWCLLYRTMFVLHAMYDNHLRMCVVASTDSSLLNMTFFFTMGFDFIIMCTTAVALLGRHSARTDLWKLLFTDGLVYFVVTFSMNCVPAVLNLLNLNCTSIAACRAVMRLLDYNSDVYIHSLAVIPSSDLRNSTPFALPSVPRFALTRSEGVLVTTEHITMSEIQSPMGAVITYSKTDLP
ncbi:hypothetical protein FB45DRAFT_903396, partial [Roridomyces roridus]